MLVWGNKLESDYQCGGPGLSEATYIKGLNSPLKKQVNIPYVPWKNMGVSKIGVGPQNGWFISWKTLLKLMIWGVLRPYFWFNTHMGNNFLNIFPMICPPPRNLYLETVETGVRLVRSATCFGGKTPVEKMFAIFSVHQKDLKDDICP